MRNGKISMMKSNMNQEKETFYGDPLHWGFTNDVIGEICIVSCSNLPFGHAFLVFHSYFDMTLDFTELTKGYEFGTWEELSPCLYEIDKLEYVSIGNAGKGLFGSSQISETSSTGDDNDDAGIYFNREFANEANSNKSLYDENAAYSRYITIFQLTTLLETCSENNYYNLVTNNCSIVASYSWNRTFEDDLIPVLIVPYDLKKQLYKKNGSFIFDMNNIL